MCIRDRFMGYLQAVADAPDCAQSECASDCPETAADKVDIVIQIALLHLRVGAPDAGQDGEPGKRLSRITEQKLKKRALTF